MSEKLHRGMRVRICPPYKRALSHLEKQKPCSGVITGFAKNGRAALVRRDGTRGSTYYLLSDLEPLETLEPTEIAATAGSQTRSPPMPTTPSATHSHGCRPTFKTRDKREVWLANNCVCTVNGHGCEVLAWSKDAADWLRVNVAPSRELDVLLERLPYLSADTRQSTEAFRRDRS